MRVLHFADLHLDAPFAWARHDVARRRRQALRACLERVVAVAEEERADAILCGGDLYEHDYATPDTRELLRTAFGDASMPVLLAPGNHDWLGPGSLYREIAWPRQVKVFTEPHLEPHELTPGLVVWGGAFTTPTRTETFLVADPRRASFPSSSGSSPRRAADSVGPDLSRHVAPAVTALGGQGGALHLGLFHGTALGAFPSEETEVHAPFLPADVGRCGFVHAFVGHYHQPVDHDLYTYPGNPDPLTFGETGERGVVIADIDADGTIRRRRRTVAVSAVHAVEVDLSACSHFQEVREVVAARLAGLAGVVRLDLIGELQSEVELDVEALGHPPQGIDQLVVRAGALEPGYDFDALAAEPSVRGRFVAKVRSDATLDAVMRRRVLVTGLRALADRDDLEAF